MLKYLGVDLGGTKLSYVLADADGIFLDHKKYTSPYRQTGRKLNDGSPELYIDTVFSDIPMEKRVAHYLAVTEGEFMDAAGNPEIEAKGYSLCGKTWVSDGKIRMIGGNTPARLAKDPGDGKLGITVADDDDHIVSANDGNAAAQAQGIHYLAVESIRPEETGYMILGTGFGFGVPGYFAMTEIGHTAVSLMPEALWQDCGCTEGHRTACAENYASGRGIKNTAERFLELDSHILEKLSIQLEPVMGKRDIKESVARSVLKKGTVDAEDVMNSARDESDGLAVFIAELAAYVSAFAAVDAAYLFGLQRIGVGETLALENIWHVNRISRIAAEYTQGSTLLRPSFIVEPTPIVNPAKYGALSLVVPESRYEAWAEKMK